MTYSAVAMNTKTETIVLPTTSSQVVLFAVASPIGKIAKATGTPVGMVNSMNQKIYEAVRAYHIANQGDDRQEINEAEKEYEIMKLVHGEQAVQEVMEYYNENVIRKAR
jgi:hypothetical protein